MENGIKPVSIVSQLSCYGLIELIAIIMNGKYNTKRNRFAEQASWPAIRPSFINAQSQRTAN